MENRLSRSRTNYMLGGVCGGLGNYLRIDPTLIRIFFIILLLASGAGLWVYLLLWIILPREDEAADHPFSPEDFGSRARQMGEEFGEAVRNPNTNSVRFIGVALILAGLIFLLQNLNLPWLRWMDGDILWPLLLIVGGGALIWRTIKGDRS